MREDVPPDARPTSVELEEFMEQRNVEDKHRDFLRRRSPEVQRKVLADFRIHKCIQNNGANLRAYIRSLEDIHREQPSVVVDQQREDVARPDYRQEREQREPDTGTTEGNRDRWEQPNRQQWGHRRDGSGTQRPGWDDYDREERQRERLGRSPTGAPTTTPTTTAATRRGAITGMRRTTGKPRGRHTAD